MRQHYTLHDLIRCLVPFLPTPMWSFTLWQRPGTSLAPMVPRENKNALKEAMSADWLEAQCCGGVGRLQVQRVLPYLPYIGLVVEQSSLADLCVSTNVLGLIGRNLLGPSNLSDYQLLSIQILIRKQPGLIEKLPSPQCLYLPVHFILALIDDFL